MPIFTTRAHVFQIDPVTKKTWKPSSTQAVPVSYYHDSAKNSYRIISVDGTKALINTLLLPTMRFTKTSLKFGQWTDAKANTVYGLGFGSENDLAKVNVRLVLSVLYDAMMFTSYDCSLKDRNERR